MKTPFTYHVARVVRWVDADTVDIDIDLGFGVFRRSRFRLAGINAFEKYEARGKRAHSALLDLCPEGSQITVSTFRRDWRDDKTGKYGRYLADVTVKATGVIVNNWLLQEGHAIESPW